MGYVGRQLAVSALAANAIRPTPTWWTGVPAMVAGWLTTEFSPHVMAGVAADTAAEVLRTRNARHALLGAANLAALGYVWRLSRSAEHSFDAALIEALGADYRRQLEARYTDVDWDWKTPVGQLLWPFSARVRDVEVRRNLPYAPEHGRRGLLDVYHPAGDVTDAPILLQVHGGAWTVGNKDQQGLPLMRHMAARGWVCVAINYRLAPRSPFPAQIVDVKRAIAWVREHAEEFGGDPGFIAITGGSAGGHLAALAALSANDPDYQPGFEDADTSLQAAVPFYGVYDFAGATGAKAAIRMRDRFLGPTVLLQDPAEDLAPFEKASPYLRVRKDAPPFYVIHGTNDTLVEVAQARAFVEALRAVSEQPVAYTELKGTHHAFDVLPSIRSQASVRHVERFLRWAHDGWRGVARAQSGADWEATDPQDEPRQTTSA
jgi:acetyl esterase/lipase